MWVWLLASVWAACPDAPDDVVRTATGAVEVAFVEVDEARFAQAAESLREALPCSTEPIDRQSALFLHRAWALMRFVDGDRAAAQRSFRAIRRLDPSWQPPEALISPGHPLESLWESSVPMGGAVRVEAAPEGGWRVDGREREEVPTDAAFVLQGLDADGSVVLTGYYASVSEIPISDLSALAAPPSVSPRRKKARLVGSVASGVALVAGGTFFVLANGQANQLDTVPVAEVPEVEARVRRYSAIGGVLTGLGAAGGIVTWAVPW